MQTNNNLLAVGAEKNKRQLTTYHETKVGNHLFHVTSVFLGKVELATALEDLAISKILRQEKVSNANSI